MSDFRDEIAIEYGDHEHEVFFVWCGRRFRVLKAQSSYSLMTPTYHRYSDTDSYAYVNPHVKFELDLYYLPPPPRPVKRSWAKAMGLKKPLAPASRETKKE